MTSAEEAREMGMTAVEYRMCYDMEATAEHIKVLIKPGKMSQKSREFVALKAKQTIDRMNEIIAKVS
jgi:hypothetical protein